MEYISLLPVAWQMSMCTAEGNVIHAEQPCGIQHFHVTAKQAVHMLIGAMQQQSGTSDEL